MRSNSLLKAFSVVVFLSVTAAQIRYDIQSHPNWNLLNQGRNCGNDNPHFRIIGGTDAMLGQYPWMARLGYGSISWYGSSVDYYCAGSIISNRYILTAAHCGPDVVGTNMVQVAVGEYDTRTDPDCTREACAPPVQIIEVESITCHEQFDQKSKFNDICLVRLARPISFNNSVQPICLPVYDYISNNLNEEIVEVAGWGYTDTRVRTLSPVLQTIKLPVVPLDTCAYIWSQGSISLSRNQICVGGIPGKGCYNGDSGGPLMKLYSGQGYSRYFQIGIVGYGPDNCDTAVPGVYTKVASYVDWILDHIRP